MDNFSKIWFLMNYCKLLWCCKTSTLLCLDTYGCLKWWNVFIFLEYQSLVVLTPCVTLSWFLGHLVQWPKYNVIISKSKTLLELELKDWFRVDCDFIIQIPLYSSIIMVWSILLKTYEKLSFGLVLWCTKSCFHLSFQDFERYLLPLVPTLASRREIENLAWPWNHQTIEGTFEGVEFVVVHPSPISAKVLPCQFNHKSSFDHRAMSVFHVLVVAGIPILL
jgi:hypothetical protein